MIEAKKSITAYWKITICLIVFFISYAVNFILPFEKTLFNFRDITERMWLWCETLISGLAIFYIFKIKKFSPKDLIVSIILGIMSSTYYSYISGICTTICYYSACQIFRKYSQQDKYFDLGAKNTLKSLLWGIVYAVPFAIANNLGMFFGNVRVTNIVAAFLYALSPGISEEVIFHFFLIALVNIIFRGNIPKNKFGILLTYILTIVPHSLIHLPLNFIQNPIGALLQFAITSVVFSIPMVWLVRNKNLQTAIAFHWFVDFIRILFIA